MIKEIISYPSFFNENLTFGREKCAITLICPQENDTHADLIIEKINKNENKKIYKLSFYNSGTSGQTFCFSQIAPEIKIIKSDSTNTILFSRSTNTWIIDADKAKTLIKIAKKELHDPIEYPTAFSFYGNKSIFSPYIEKIKISNSSDLKKLYQTHPSFYRELVDISNACINKHKVGMNIFRSVFFVPTMEGGYFIDSESFDEIGGETDHYQTNSDSEGNQYYSKVTVKEHLGSFVYGMKTEIRNINNLEELKNYCEMIRIRFEKADKEMGGISISGTRYECIKFISSVIQNIHNRFKDVNLVVLRIFKNLKKSTFLENIISSCKSDYLMACKKLLIMVHDNSEIIRFKGHNCFTWAREKMRMVNVELGEKFSDKIIANPKWYTTENK